MTMQTPQFNDILLYTAPDGAVKVEVLYEGETFWLSQKKMAELFGVDVRTISEHLQNIYKSGELDLEATVRKFRMVQTEGSREVAREIDFYNLDAIIATGYRVNSHQATRFRIVTMYLDYAENQAERQKAMYMRDWVEKLDAFLKFNEYEVLTNAGTVSAEVAKSLAGQEYEKFRLVQDQTYESDFDREAKRMLGKGK